MIRSFNITALLYYASLTELSKQVQLLLNERADVNAQSEAYNNSLQVTSFKGFSSIVQLLLKCEADMNVKDSFINNELINTQDIMNSTSLIAASTEAVVQLLLNNEADVNAQAEKYDTALLAAPDYE